MKQEKKLRLKVVNVPWFEHRFITSTKINVPFFPPMGTSVLTSYLRKAGFNVEQDDLNIKLYHHNKCGKTIDLSMFMDRERVISGLRQGNDTKIQDCIKKVMSLTDFDNYDVILLSNQHEWNISSSAIGLFLAKELKNRGIPTIMGGRATRMAEIFSREANIKAVDCFIPGYGMHKLYSILKNFESSKKFEPKSDATPPFPPRDVNDIICIPDFDGLPLNLYRWIPDKRLIDKDLWRYADTESWVLPYTFLFGCPYRCAFCNYRMDGFKLKSPDVVIREIKELMRKYKTRYFFFHNSTINFSQDYVEELCGLIIKNRLDILWSDSARADKLSKKLLQKMRWAGCIRLIYGIDSGSQKVLDYLHKDILVNEMAQVLKWTHEAGIWCGVNLIAGSPFETEEDFGHTVRFIEKNSKYIDKLALFPFTLLPSVFFVRADEFGLVNTKSDNPLLESYTFDEKNGLKWEAKKEQIQNFYNKMFSLFPHLINTVPFEEFHYLCFLYSMCGEKSKVKEAYTKIVKRFYSSLVFDWECLKSKITSPNGLSEIYSRVRGVVCRPG